MDDKELVGAINYELAQSVTGADSEYQTARAKALEYYRNDSRGDERPGRSQVQSTDVQSMVDQTISQIMPRFARRLVAEYRPLGADDVEFAEAETATVNRLIMENCDGYQVLRSGLFDAVLQMLSGCVVYWDDQSNKKTIEDYDGPLTDDQVAAIMAPRADGETVEVIEQAIEQEERIVTDGMLVLATESVPVTMALKVRRTTPKPKLKIVPIPPEYLRIPADAVGLDADIMRFVAHETTISASELIEMGYDEDFVAGLPNATAILENVDSAARLSNQGEVYSTGHKSTANKSLTEAWYLIDYDGDGIAERRHIWVSGSEVLKNDEITDEVDVVLGTAFPQPHQAYGNSMYHKEKQVQDIKTGFLRQSMDGGQLAIDQRLMVEEGAAEPKSLTQSRAGGIVWIKPNRMGSVQPLSMPSGFDQALPLLQYMDKMRSETGGNALDMSGENAPVPGSTAHGVERIITAREQMVADISESFSQTFVKRLFQVTHRVLRRANAPVLMETQDGGFEQVGAGLWPEREDISVNLGPTMAQRQQRQAALQMVIDRQNQEVERGSILVTPDRQYQAYIDLGDAFELPGANQYFLDPNSEEAAQIMQQRQAAQEQQQAEQQAIMQQQMATQQAAIQAQAQLEAAKLMQKANSEQNSLEFDYHKLNEELELDYTKLRRERETD